MDWNLTFQFSCYFQADTSCRNKNHILRLPFSYNCKKNPLQTRLHKLCSPENTSIKRLDYFYRSKEQIDSYTDACNKEKAEKSAKTRELNKQNNTIDKMPAKRTSKTSINKMSTNFCVPPENMKYFDDFRRNARYWNIIKDLHNYYVRHNGNITGFRNTFIHIMATFLKRVYMSVDEAVDFVEPYCTTDFLEEAEKTVNSIYNSNKVYLYNNDSIALLLGFTDNDYALSYCCYNESSRKERKRESNRRAKDKQFKDARQKKKDARQELISFINENPDISTGDIAIIFGVSTRTIQRIKKDLKMS